MRTALKFLSVGPGENIHTFGDEAYLAVSGLGGITVIRFRKKNIYVELVAPSKELAMDLAETLADFITEKD